MINFYNHKPQELLDIILQGNEQSDNAMYYLLQDRLYNKFKEKYDMIHKKNIEDLSDILDDFFLYLREENRKTTRPYTILYTIRK